MEHWQEFFIRNRIIILFVYGQVFFILGLAIIWQSRRHSRLVLARSLGWLGAFGLTHGLHEWGDIFIPIQAGYLNRAWVETLVVIQICLLAFSFACLFQFGVETLYRLQPRFRWLQAVPAGLLLVWVSAFLWTSQVSRWPPAQSLVLADIWARYLLAFPGAIVAALALRQHTQRQIGQAFPHIARTFQAASLALALYALCGGLLAPAAAFFPASVINAEAVTNLLGLPVQVLRSIAGLVLVIAIVRGLEIFEMEVDQRLERMEQAQFLLAERERVSRELHDGAIQTVYTAGLLAESVRKKMADDNPLALRLDRVIGALRSAIEDLRQFVAGLEEPDAAGENLAAGLRKLVEEPSLQSLIRVETNIQCAEDDCLSPTRTAHVLAVVNEALSNVVRHAHGRQAWVAAERHNGQLEVRIADDGRGFERDSMSGFGLRNMRDRARLLGGTLRVEPRSPHGAQVVLTVPWQDAP